MKKQWLTFDLDGTLMQNPFSDWVFPEIESKINSELKTEVNIKNILFGKHHEKMRKNQFYDAYDWDNIVYEVIDELKIPIKIDVEEIVVKHSVKSKVYLLEDDIVESLLRLKSLGYSLAVVTNGFFKYQYPVMKTLKIHDLFEKVITPELCKTAKPDPKILHELDDKGEIIAHIGDRIDHDVVLPNKLGITSVFIKRNLSDSFKGISVDRRKNKEDILALCEEKWKRENGTNRRPFVKSCIPDLIIGSISELPDYFSF